MLTKEQADQVKKQLLDQIENLPPEKRGAIKSKIESPQLAAKSVIEKCLDGDENEGKAGAGVLFRRIFARWASDLDLGRKVKVEVEEIRRGTQPVTD
jgi:hypothetical protein